MKLPRLLTAAAILAALASTASAGVLSNKDSKAYSITFEQGAGSVSAKVPANKTVSFRCSQLPCKITLDKSGQSVQLRRSDLDVVIEKGKIKLKDQRTASR